MYLSNETNQHKFISSCNYRDSYRNRSNFYTGPANVHIHEQEVSLRGFNVRPHCSSARGYFALRTIKVPCHLLLTFKTISLYNE